MLDRLIDLLISFVHLFRFWQVVDHYQEGVVLRFGKFDRKLLPGIHLIIPFTVEEVLLDTVKPTTHNLVQQSLITSDGIHVVVTGVITREITDIQAALLECESVEDVIVDSAFGVISSMVRNATWEELTSDDFVKEVRQKINTRAKEFGVTIKRFQWQDCTKSLNLRIWNN